LRYKIYIEHAIKKQPPIYDDQTLENMKRYFKNESHDALLNYMKKYGHVVVTGIAIHNNKILFFAIITDNRI
jgi:hypothetical protein